EDQFGRRVGIDPLGAEQRRRGDTGHHSLFLRPQPGGNRPIPCSQFATSPLVHIAVDPITRPTQLAFRPHSRADGFGTDKWCSTHAGRVPRQSDIPRNCNWRRRLSRNTSRNTVSRRTYAFAIVTRTPSPMSAPSAGSPNSKLVARISPAIRSR